MKKEGRMKIDALPQAVIFDMDGLMVDSEPVWGRAWRLALEQNSLDFKDGFQEALTGTARERALQLTYEIYGRSPQVTQAFDDHYTIVEQLFAQSGAPKKPGLDELLATLAAHDIPVAVASSTEYASVAAILKHAGVFDYFQAIKTGDQGFRSKPAPDIFLGAAAALGVDPANAWVLEDSLPGIQAARTGGFTPIMVPDLVQPSDELRRQITVCDTLHDVRAIFESLLPAPA